MITTKTFNVAHWVELAEMGIVKVVSYVGLQQWIDLEVGLKLHPPLVDPVMEQPVGRTSPIG